ncbi:hypothetical protein [Nitratifractor salsuginis]|uniref:Bacteriophage lambda Replication protein O N-terminal domain-containing protein n=1 Tax=Nitratifractor salsuginis (strain DSM 16511 / JCM 12458 / E9I37-1) TaxID=749222 RepID=E6WYD8_NITSE|nr:hypothetical protein [Nitratifractor salsuginis]ADV46450.1 hypothetical protein Nitsa_1197 [Nitratifractor salsuginis DSM 16511]
MIIKKLRSDYTHIPNEIITDPNVTDKALRIYCYMMSKPDRWNFYRDDIKKQVGIKTNEAVAKALKCLIDAGWITRSKATPNLAKKYGCNNGTYIYTIFDVCRKVGEAENTGEPENSVGPNIRETRTHSKTDISSKTELSSKTEGESLPPSVNKKAWAEWIAYKGKGYKGVSKTKAINLLSKFTYEEQQEMVDTAIMSGWKGIFPPKRRPKQETQPELILC